MLANRVRMGSVVGGDDKTGSPGGNKLIAGDMSAGFFGEVGVEELFSGLELADIVNITSGQVQFSNEPWLKFAIDDKIIFKSKKPFRSNISWTDINNQGCADGTKQVTKGGIDYKVRLMKGSLTNPSAYNDLDAGTHGSEWNRLMLPIHKNAKDDIGWFKDEYVEMPTPYWDINYDDRDLHTDIDYGNGTYHWCQEKSGSNTARHIYRGFRGTSFTGHAQSNYGGSYNGWSPVLEVIK